MRLDELAADEEVVARGEPDVIGGLERGSVVPDGGARGSGREAFAGFDPKKVARFDDAKMAELLTDEGIIRNRLKIASAVRNAKAFLKIQNEFGSFDRYIWSFVGEPIVNRLKGGDVPATSEISEAISKDLKKRGFNFVGSTIVYAFMQATGMVNDHLVSCFRYRQVGGHP
jgi:DNA-3-methyladenine glycosylase I